MNPQKGTGGGGQRFNELKKEGVQGRTNIKVGGGHQSPRNT